jgi:hypothetical protein
MWASSWILQSFWHHTTDSTRVEVKKNISLSLSLIVESGLPPCGCGCRLSDDSCLILCPTFIYLSYLNPNSSLSTIHDSQDLSILISRIVFIESTTPPLGPFAVASLPHHSSLTSQCAYPAASASQHQRSSS